MKLFSVVSRMACLWVDYADMIVSEYLDLTDRKRNSKKQRLYLWKARSSSLLSLIKRIALVCASAESIRLLSVDNTIFFLFFLPPAGY